MECVVWRNEQLSMLGVHRLRVESASETVQPASPPRRLAAQVLPSQHYRQVANYLSGKPVLAQPIYIGSQFLAHSNTPCC